MWPDDWPDLREVPFYNSKEMYEEDVMECPHCKTEMIVLLREYENENVIRTLYKCKTCGLKKENDATNREG